MVDDKKYDDETQKFYEKNKDMIDKILAQEMASASDDSERKYLEEVLRRASFERRMRMEYEAEKARREAFDNSEKVCADFKTVRDRTEEAIDEARDHFRDYSRRERDYFFDMFLDEAERFRNSSRRGREYARSRFDEDRALIRESRDRARSVFNETFDEYFAPFSDTQFQRHLFGAGMELWMALNSFIRSAPLPESLKEAFNEADENRNSEYCRKNESCRANENHEKSTRPQANKVKITPLKKESE